MPVVHQPSASGNPHHAAFDRHALPAHVAAAVWTGADFGTYIARTVPTGFDALDAELPGGGWPTHSLTEMLLAQPALCEWRLLGPSLSRLVSNGGRLYLVAPPKRPHAGGLAQLGVPAEQIVWITAAIPSERLWVTEQLVKSDPAGVILSWLPQARPEQIRRLQVHAQSCDAPVFLIRPVSALADTSPAPLRLTAALGVGWHLDVRIQKRRGAALDRVLALPAMPGNLGIVIPPRLRTLRVDDASIFSTPQEAHDARALGRTSSDTAQRVLGAH